MKTQILNLKKLKIQVPMRYLTLYFIIFTICFYFIIFSKTNENSNTNLKKFKTQLPIGYLTIYFIIFTIYFYFIIFAIYLILLLLRS
jgi:hypothetical protein